MPESRLQRTRQQYQKHLNCPRCGMSLDLGLRTPLCVNPRCSVIFLLSEQPEADLPNVYDTADTPWGV